MNKFIIKLSGYLFLLSMFVIVINAIYIANEKSDSDHTSKFQNVPDNIRICNLGSSHGLYGFDYSALANDYVCFNFGLESQTISYDYRILKNYINKLEEGAVVFVIISFPSLFGASEVNDSGFEAKNNRYYKFLPPNLIKEYDAFTEFYVCKFPSLIAYENLFITLTGNSIDTNDIMWQKSLDPAILDVNAFSAYNMHVGTGKTDESGNRIHNEEEITALYEIFDLCISYDVVPVMVTTPYTSEYMNMVKSESPDFLDDFYGLIESISNDTGVPYYDYSEDSRFSREYYLFMDSNHLNKSGACKFVDILISEVLGWL